MKIIGLVIMLVISLQWVSAQNLDPYILGFETTETILDIKEKVATNLQQNGIKVIGQYQPATDENRLVLVFTSTELESAVKQIGGLSGFAAALRVGITREGEKTIVSYTNPVYWGNAYFRDDFDKVASNYSTLTTHLESAMKVSGSFVGKPFGSEKGLSVKICVITAICLVCHVLTALWNWEILIATKLHSQK